MYKRLSIAILFVALFSPAPAHADPISAVVIGWIGLTGIAGTIATAVLTVALSYAATAAVSSLIGRKQSDILRELQMPTSLPVYRFVYGECWAPGTPAPVRVKGEIIYACYILNSRPSEGPFKVFLDKREVVIAGDPYDFSGWGATGENHPFHDHVRYWIGRGDQTSPPFIVLTEAGEYYTASDAWTGCTVLWVRLIAGKNKEMQERWPSTPPEVMVEGKWSLVLDPRDPEAPPAYSANQALCILDALRNNPLRPYDDRNLWLETFEWAADVADSEFPVKAGGTIPRFEINGVLPFSDGAEVEDQIGPMLDAGASRAIRVGGKLGIVPAVYSDPVATITDVLSDQPMTFNRYRPTSELVTEVSGTYTAPDRTYEDASSPTYTLVGAQTEDGGAPKMGQYNLRLVTDHRQAQYVAAIIGRRTRMQKSWSGAIGAEGFDLVACSTVELDLPAPYINRNGIYEVEQVHPGGDMVGESGFAMRCAIQMRETSPDIYDWNPAVDEQDIATETFNPYMDPVQPPGAITVLSDETTAVTTGGAMVARVRFSFDPSPSATVVAYEWQYRVGSDPWQSGGVIDAAVIDDDDKVFGFLAPATVGESYTIRVFASSVGGASSPVDSSSITASVGPPLVVAPTPISAVGGSGQISVTFQAPNNSGYRSMEIWGNDTDTTVGATLLFGPIYGSANSIVAETETGLGAAETRYYFGKSFDINGSPSAFSASISGTTD